MATGLRQEAERRVPNACEVPEEAVRLYLAV